MGHCSGYCVASAREQIMQLDQSNLVQEEWLAAPVAAYLFNPNLTLALANPVGNGRWVACACPFPRCTRRGVRGCHGVNHVYHVS